MAKKKVRTPDTDTILDIDLNRLDKEWLEQPRLYYKFAEAQAKARKEKDTAYAELKIEQAEAYLAVRSNPKRYKLPEKITEGLINNTATTLITVKEAQEKLRDATYKYDLLSGALEALNQRKSALENAVKLHGQNYFSTPMGTNEDKEVLTETKRKRMNKRRREENKTSIG